MKVHFLRLLKGTGVCLIPLVLVMIVLPLLNYAAERVGLDKVDIKLWVDGLFYLATTYVLGWAMEGFRKS